MRLKQVSMNPLYPIRVTCCTCGEQILAHHAQADLDGEPFVAYYCEPCAAACRAEEMRRAFA